MRSPRDSVNNSPSSATSSNSGSVIRIGLPFRPGGEGKVNEINRKCVEGANSQRSTRHNKIEAVEIDWRYAITDEEVKERLEDYKRELNATVFSDRDLQYYSEQEKKDLMAQAKECYKKRGNKGLEQAIDDYLNQIDALYIPGIGFNPSQAYAVEDTNKRVAGMGLFLIDPDKRREEFEIKLVRKAIERGMPVLGVCAGSWLVAACFPGAKTKTITNPESYKLNDTGNARFPFHSVQFTPNTNVGGIASNASAWTPDRDDQGQLLKSLRAKTDSEKNTSEQKIELTIHDTRVDENTFSPGYHLMYDQEAKDWKLFYTKRDAINLVENINPEKWVSVSLVLDLIPGLKELLLNKNPQEIYQEKNNIENILTQGFLSWVNSTHWRVLVAQDEETGKIDNDNQLIVSAIEPQYRTIEAFETKFGVPIIGVQWHPELTIPQWKTATGYLPNPDYATSRRIMEAFAESAEVYANKKKLTAEIKTRLTNHTEMKADSSTSSPRLEINFDRNKTKKTMRRTQTDGASFTAFNNEGLTLPLVIGKDHKSKEDLTEQSIFRAASLSKPVFAYLVLKLIEINNPKNAKPESGEFNKPFDLDTPLYKILPSILDKFPDEEDKERAKRLTARLVLSHSTGLPMNQRRKNLNFDAEPGTFGYSNPAIAILHSVIDELTGSNIHTLAKIHIFTPLNMKNSNFLPPEYLPENENQKLTEEQLAQIHAANSLHTTSNDYALFITKWLNDEKLNYAFQPQVYLNDEKCVRGLLQEKGHKLAWAIGFAVQVDNKGKIVRLFHEADMNEYRGLLAYDLEKNFGMVGFGNSPHSFMLLADVISKNVDIREWLEYTFETTGFARKIERNWKEKEMQRVIDIIDTYEYRDKDVSDKVMAEHPFGQQSNTAKGLNSTTSTAKLMGGPLAFKVVTKPDILNSASHVKKLDSQKTLDDNVDTKDNSKQMLGSDLEQSTPHNVNPESTEQTPRNKPK